MRVCRVAIFWVFLVIFIPFVQADKLSVSWAPEYPVVGQRVVFTAHTDQDVLDYGWGFGRRSIIVSDEPSYSWVFYRPGSPEVSVFARIGEKKYLPWEGRVIIRDVPPDPGRLMITQLNSVLSGAEVSSLDDYVHMTFESEIYGPREEDRVYLLLLDSRKMSADDYADAKNSFFGPFESEETKGVAVMFDVSSQTISVAARHSTLSLERVAGISRSLLETGALAERVLVVVDSLFRRMHGLACNRNVPEPTEVDLSCKKVRSGGEQTVEKTTYRVDESTCVLEAREVTEVEFVDSCSTECELEPSTVETMVSCENDVRRIKVERKIVDWDTCSYDSETSYREIEGVCPSACEMVLPDVDTYDVVEGILSEAGVEYGRESSTTERGGPSGTGSLSVFPEHPNAYEDVILTFSTTIEDPYPGVPDYYLWRVGGRSYVTASGALTFPYTEGTTSVRVGVGNAVTHESSVGCVSRNVVNEREYRVVDFNTCEQSLERAQQATGEVCSCDLEPRSAEIEEVRCVDDENSLYREREYIVDDDCKQKTIVTERVLPNERCGSLCPDEKHWNGRECSYSRLNIVVLSSGWSPDGDDAFESDLKKSIDFFSGMSPFRTCDSVDDRFNIQVVKPSECDLKCDTMCHCAFSWRSCVPDGADFVADYVSVLTESTLQCVRGAGGGCMGCSANNLFSVVRGGKHVFSHEFGHSLDLHHVTGCGSPESACRGPNALDCQEPDKESFVMSYCYQKYFGPAAYSYFERVKLAPYLGGCEG